MAAKKKSPLGRGLEALLAHNDFPDVDQGQIFFCPVEKLHPNPFQPRSCLLDTDLKALEESIRQRGILQPILVKPDNGKYIILAGERRWRAAKRAGLEKVPVVAREADAQEQLLVALIENLQREDLNVVEEAEAYKNLREEFGLSQQEIASQVGKNRTTVANLLRLLSLPGPVLELVRGDLLSQGHAKVLLSLKDTDVQVRLADRVISEGLSVRALEKIVKDLRKMPKGVQRFKTYREEEQALQRVLHTKVTIRGRGQKGKISIEFSSEAHLREILRFFQKD